MSRTSSSSLFGSLVLALSSLGCGAAPGGGAAEPALADSARPVTLEAPLAGELAPPCDRLAFSFRPAETGEYDWSFRSDVPASMRLFAMSPDLYLATGSREGDVSHVSSTLDADVEYAVTVTPRECRAAAYQVAITRR